MNLGCLYLILQKYMKPVHDDVQTQVYIVLRERLPFLAFKYVNNLVFISIFEANYFGRLTFPYVTKFDKGNICNLMFANVDFRN